MNSLLKIFLILLTLASTMYAQLNEPADAKGMFLTVGVGPRFPIGNLGSQQTIGAGFEAMISFTDNNLAPTFFYLNIGYQNHPGDYDFYKTSDHSSISANIISFHGGTRYFFEPVIKDMILLMPFLEGGVTYAYVEKYHQFKIDTGKNDDLQSLSRLGFHFGGGLSFFLMDVIGTYTYLESNQYFSFNLRLTIPLAITL